MNRIPIVRTTVLTLSLGMSLGLSLTACGGGSPSSVASGGSTSASLSAFQACLKQHGITFTPRARPSGFPSGGPGAGGFPSGAGAGGGGGGAGAGGARGAAFQACAKYAPNGFRNRTPISSSALAAFKSCMGQHGITVTGTTFRQLLASGTGSTKAAQAFSVCRVLLPARPSPRASSSPTPSPSA